MALREQPRGGAEMTARGHEPMSHGYRWLPSFSLTLEEEREHVRKAARRSSERPGNVRSAGTRAAPASIRASCSSRRAGSSTTAIAMRTTSRTSSRSDGRRWLTIPYSFETNDQKLSASRQLRAGRFSRAAQGGVRLPACRGSYSSEDDDGRPAHAAHRRPAGAAGDRKSSATRGGRRACGSRAGSTSRAGGSSTTASFQQ